MDDPHIRIEDMACDVIQLLDELEINETIVAGHSMGGYIALDIARQIPERVAGIALIASHIFADSPEKKTERLHTVQQLERTPPREVFSTMPKKLSLDLHIQEYCRNIIQETRAVGLQGALHAMAYRKSSAELWKKLSMPKLLLSGSDDQFIPSELCEQMARIGRNVIYKMLDDAGHMLMREKPAETAAEIAHFINNVRRN